MPQTMLGSPARRPDGGALRNDHHGAVRARRERARHAAEHGRAQRSAAARADDDQAGAHLVGGLEQARRRRALDEADLVVGVQAEPLPQRCRELLGRLDRLLDHVQRDQLRTQAVGEPPRDVGHRPGRVGRIHPTDNGLEHSSPHGRVNTRSVVPRPRGRADASLSPAPHARCRWGPAQAEKPNSSGSRAGSGSGASSSRARMSK